MPIDDAALVRAVLAAPADDAPRLAYADHLDRSHDEADRARAEFIRLQINLVRATDAEPMWPAMTGRARDLLDRHRPAWERPLRRLFRPTVASPGRWLSDRLFGSGGTWGFRRGFVEHVLAPAPIFLEQDAAILDHAPVRRVVLSHASDAVGRLLADSRLTGLASLHLVGDMEMDEDLNLLTACARAAGLTVLEFRFPRLQPDDMEGLFALLRAPDRDDRPREADAFPQWAEAGPAARRRLDDLAASPRTRLLLAEPDTAHEGEVLALNEWVYLGDELTTAGVWAVAKAHQDLGDEAGRCRRLILLRPGRDAALRQSPYFLASGDA